MDRFLISLLMYLCFLLFFWWSAIFNSFLSPCQLILFFVSLLRLYEWDTYLAKTQIFVVFLMSLNFLLLVYLGECWDFYTLLNIWGFCSPRYKFWIWYIRQLLLSWFPREGNGNPFWYCPGKPHGQRSLVGYSPWGHKSVRHSLSTKEQ